MQYQTRFIETSDAETLTDEVNALERAGWEFVSVQLACVMRPSPANRGIGRDETPRRPPAVVSKMLATLRREVRPGEEGAPPDRPSTKTSLDPWNDDGDDDGDDDGHDG